MQRGELYRVRHPSGDARLFRTFIVASRNGFLEANYASATFVPVYSTIHGLDTEIVLDERNGLKHPSAGRCDDLQRVLRRDLTDFVGALHRSQLVDFSRALANALEILPEHLEDL
jgi:mRNA interferase MazF